MTCKHNTIYHIGLQEFPSTGKYLKLGNCFSCKATICHDGGYIPTQFYFTNKRINMNRAPVLRKIS